MYLQTNLSPVRSLYCNFSKGSTKLKQYLISHTHTVRLTWQNIVLIDPDVLVSVTAAVLVPTPQGMQYLVHDDTLVLTHGPYRNILLTFLTTNKREAPADKTESHWQHLPYGDIRHCYFPEYQLYSLHLLPTLKYLPNKIFVSFFGERHLKWTFMTKMNVFGTRPQKWHWNCLIWLAHASTGNWLVTFESQRLTQWPKE